MAYIFQIKGRDKRFLQKEHLGKGAFGQVYRVTDSCNHKCSCPQQSYAVKIIKTHNSDLLQEVKPLTELRHANIMQIYAAEQTGPQLRILLEYCPGSSLDKKLKPNVSTTIEQNIKWALQVTVAITYLHTNNILHRDLKPQNILLTANEDAKVADFGLARPFMTGPNWQELYRTYYLKTIAGTPSYMAPEVWEGHYTDRADVYSIGVMLLVMFGRKADPNFYTIVEEDARAVVQKMYTSGNVDAYIKKLVIDMLACNPQARPPAFQVYERILAFSKGIGWWDWLWTRCTIL